MFINIPLEYIMKTKKYMFFFIILIIFIEIKIIFFKKTIFNFAQTKKKPDDYNINQPAGNRAFHNNFILIFF